MPLRLLPKTAVPHRELLGSTRFSGQSRRPPNRSNSLSILTLLKSDRILKASHWRSDRRMAVHAEQVRFSGMTVPLGRVAGS